MSVANRSNSISINGRAMPVVNVIGLGLSSG
jgi:hypothetical protein